MSFPVSPPATPDVFWHEHEFWEILPDQEKIPEEQSFLQKDAALARREVWIALVLSLLVHGLGLLFAAAVSQTGAVSSGQPCYITVDLMGPGAEGGGGEAGEGGKEGGPGGALPAAGSTQAGESAPVLQWGGQMAEPDPPAVDSAALEGSSPKGESEPSAPSEVRMEPAAGPDPQDRTPAVSRPQPNVPAAVEGLRPPSASKNKSPPIAPDLKPDNRRKSKSAADKGRTGPADHASPTAVHASTTQRVSAGPGSFGTTGQGSARDGSREIGASAGAGTGQGSGVGIGGEKGNGSGAGGPGMPGWTFSVKQVDRPPQVLRRVDPKYPKTAHDMHITGKVTVKLLVMSDGRVSNATIVEGSPPGVFDYCVLEAVGKWEFHPGCYRGKAVATWVIVPVSFKLTTN